MKKNKTIPTTHLVWIHGAEYYDFMKILGQYGFRWYGSNNIAGDGSDTFEKNFDPNYDTVYQLDFDEKIVSYFLPMELYGPNSPIRDMTKYREYEAQCKDCDEILNILHELYPERSNT